MSKSDLESWKNLLVPLWEQYYGNNLSNQSNILYMPGVPRIPTYNSLIVMGINPSASSTFYNKELRGSEHQGKGEFFLKSLLWKSRIHAQDMYENEELTYLLEIEDAIGLKHSHFRPFKKLNIEYSYLDLVYIRKTDQRELIREFFSEKSTEDAKEFINIQIQYTFNLISQSNPQGVIIANQQTSRIFINHFKDNIFGSMREYGRYLLKTPNGFVPILPLSYMGYIGKGLLEFTIYSIKESLARIPTAHEKKLDPNNELNELFFTI